MALPAGMIGLYGPKASLWIKAAWLDECSSESTQKKTIAKFYPLRMTNSWWGLRFNTLRALEENILYV